MRSENVTSVTISGPAGPGDPEDSSGSPAHHRGSGRAAGRRGGAGRLVRGPLEARRYRRYGPGRVRPAHAARRAGAGPDDRGHGPVRPGRRGGDPGGRRPTGSSRRARYAHPGGCGGCDWQHAALPAQRELKASVVRQQLRRIAGLDWPVTVEALPGDGAACRGRPRPRRGWAGGPGSGSRSAPTAWPACGPTAPTRSSTSGLPDRASRHPGPRGATAVLAGRGIGGPRYPRRTVSGRRSSLVRSVRQPGNRPRPNRCSP